MKKLLSLFALVISVNLHSQCALVVSNTNDNGAGSFRQAIIDANVCVGAPTITFTIAPSSTIILLSDLPSITHNNLLIDGTTAPGFVYPSSMVTIWWAGLDDCLQYQAGSNNNIVRGLSFTDNFLGSGDAAIRVNAGGNLLVNRCQAYNQRKNLVRVQGGNNVRVSECTAHDFNNDGSARVFEVNSGSLIAVSNCTIYNIARTVYELNGNGTGGTAGKVSIHNNSITNVGYEDGSPGNKGSHIICSYTAHTAIFSIKNNTIDSSSSKFVEFINTNGIPNNRDSIYNNTVLNVRGQQTIYVESNSGSFGGIVIDNNTLTGTGIGVDNIDQVIEIGGWSNNYFMAVISNNIISNYHGRAIMCRFSDDMTIHGNTIYNCSKDHLIEINDDCDSTVITGNYLGTNLSSDPGLAISTGNTIQLNDCNFCTIGGDRMLCLGNVIVASVNGGNRDAVYISSLCAGTTIVRGNHINVSSDGATCLSSSSNNGIYADGANVVIGGDTTSFRNDICGGSGGSGIEFRSAAGSIEGNLIGCRNNACSITGSALQYGIKVNGIANNLNIGSTTNLSLRNKIGYCQEAIRNDDRDGIQWSGNEYWGNTSAVTVNNNGASPNALIAPPVITSVTLPFTVQGTGAGGRVEIYLWDSNYPAQGFRYLGFATGSPWTFISPTSITNDVAALQISSAGMNASGFVGFDVPSQGPAGAPSCVITTLPCGFILTAPAQQTNSATINDINIYPNPASEILYISSIAHIEKEAEIEVINALGQIVLTESYRTEINISLLENGFYTIRIKSASGIRISKFIKE